MKTKTKLPKNARRVFRGVIFDVYQWPQKMFDGTTATFEMLKRPDTVEIIPIVDKKILIQEEAQPHEGKFLTVPCGRIDPRESPRAAAQRELREETGYTARRWKRWRTEYPSGFMVWTVNIFIARGCRKTHRPNPDAGEKIKPRLVTFDQFINLTDNPRFRGKNLKLILLRARYDRAVRHQLRRKLFG